MGAVYAIEFLVQLQALELEVPVRAGSAKAYTANHSARANQSSYKSQPEGSGSAPEAFGAPLRRAFAQGIADRLNVPLGRVAITGCVAGSVHVQTVVACADAGDSDRVFEELVGPPAGTLALVDPAVFEELVGPPVGTPALVDPAVFGPCSVRLVGRAGQLQRAGPRGPLLDAVGAPWRRAGSSLRPPGSPPPSYGSGLVVDIPAFAPKRSAGGVERPRAGRFERVPGFDSPDEADHGEVAGAPGGDLGGDAPLQSACLFLNPFCP